LVRGSAEESGGNEEDWRIVHRNGIPEPKYIPASDDEGLYEELDCK
jgi:hypothetical protein